MQYWVPSFDMMAFHSTDGFAVASLCRSALVECLAAVEEHGADVDLDYVKLHESYTGALNAYHCSSVIVLSEKLGISRRLLSSKLCRLASAHLVALKGQKLMLDEFFIRHFHSEQLCVHIESAAYDETPLPSNSKLAPDSADPTTNLHAPWLPLSLSSCSFGPLKADTISAKVLQIKGQHGYLIQMSGQYVKFVGDSLCPLQVLSHTNGPVLMEALLRNSWTSSFSKQFGFQARIAMHDKAAYNFSAEALLGARRSKQQSLLEFRCDAHVCSTIMKNSFDKLMPQALSGVIATALSLRHGSSLMVFRRCLSTVIDELLVLLIGSPSVEAIEFRNQAMSLFMAGRSTDLVQKVLVSRLPNGDWRRQDRVEYYYDVSQPAPTRSYIVKLLCKGLLQALLSAKPTVLMRHRWTGTDIALEEVGRVEAIHGLFSKTFVKFLASFQGPHKHLRNSEVCVAVDDDAVHSLGVASAADGADVGEVASLLTGENGGTALVDALSQSALPNVEQHRNVQEHSSDRRRAGCWLASHAWLDLVVLRITVKPLMDYMTNLLKISGEKWEVGQRAHVIEHLGKREEQTNPLLRDYEVTLAADGVLEQKFFEQLGFAFSSPEWSLIPAHGVKVSLNADAFRVLSMQGCLMEQIISCPHRSFPFAVFKGVAAGHVGQTLLRAPSCLLDDWSLSLRTAYPDCSGPAFVNCLELHAMMSSCSIASIESRHSSIRRQLVSRSVQTHKLEIHSLSSEFLMQNLRAGKRWLCWSRYGEQLPAASCLQISPELWAQEHEGTQWLIFFLRCYLLRGEKDHQEEALVPRWPLESMGEEIGAAYRRALITKDPVLQTVEKLAIAGRARAKQAKGRASVFGPTSRFLARKKVKMSRRSLWLRLQDKSGQQQAQHVNMAMSSSSELHEALSAARTIMRLEGAARKRDEDAQWRIIQNYSETVGNKQVEAIFAALPDIPFAMDSLFAVPSALGSTICIPCLAAEGVTKAAGFASHSRKSSLSSRLEYEWVQHHEPIDAEKMACHAAGKTKNPCREAGICVCSGDGPKLQQMAKKLVVVMKESFMSKLKKKMLTCGNIVACFERTGCCEMHSIDELLVWMHVGHLSLSPYRPTMHIMKRVLQPEVGRDIFPERVVLEASWESSSKSFLGFIEVHLVQATLQFQTLHVSLQALCRECSWTLTWYELENTGRVLLKFQPRYVPVKKMNLESVPFWPPRRRGKGKNPATLKRHSDTLSGAGKSTHTLAEPDPSDSRMSDVTAEDGTEEDEEEVQEEHHDNEDLLFRAEALQQLFLEVDAGDTDAHATVADKPVEQAASYEGREPHAEPGAIMPAAATSTLIAASASDGPLAGASASKPGATRGFVGTADASAYFPGGRISYYSSKHAFEAVCDCAEHHLVSRCALTRTSHGRRRKGVAAPVAGRPLGLMVVMWLSMGATTLSKEEHMSKEALQSYSYADRLAARQLLLSTLAGLELASFERECHADEEIEPLSLVGLA
eukprot:1421752-Amphidinium_carterae.6